MPRKLEAGLDGRYLISRVLMTSTMKSEPGTPPMRELDSSFGVPLSAAAICIVGGSAEGRRGAALVDAVVAACAGGTAVAAPATATPARNLRRLTSGCGCFRLIKLLPCHARRSAVDAGSPHGRYYPHGDTPESFPPGCMVTSMHAEAFPCRGGVCIAPYTESH